MESYDCDAVVVGAGVVGLAIAAALAERGRDVVVLEAADAIGTGTSSRNSEVIHSGLYYPPGSLKARLCVEGRERLYDYCSAKGVATRACGKLVVACDDTECAKLEGLLARGRINGIDDLRFVERREIHDLEPALRVASAILSPSTGIVDSHGLMRSLKNDVEEAGGIVALKTPVRGGNLDGRLVLETGGAEPARIRATVIVNAAGLGATALLAALQGFPEKHKPHVFFAKGSYFALDRASPFCRLVYPLPEAGGLGVHATLDLAGRLRFGPDVEWVASGEDMAVDDRRGAGFYSSIRRYWPDLPDSALRPDYAGIRPKLSGPGEVAADFRIEDEETHGVAGLINLLGIESPGLTASLAIGAMVTKRLAR